MRDSQKSCAYAAEHILQAFYDRAPASTPAVAIGGSTFTLPPEAKFGSLESVQAYCDQVTDMMEAPKVTVRRRKGTTKAHYERDNAVIAVADHTDRWAMREIVVLHELAHHLSPVRGHGPQFVGTFIDLLSRVMGPEVGLVLRLINDNGRVKEGV